jgi:hypothetical protein
VEPEVAPGLVALVPYGLVADGVLDALDPVYELDGIGAVPAVGAP